MGIFLGGKYLEPAFHHPVLKPVTVHRQAGIIKFTQ